MRVSHQSSLWRFSNCSKREVMTERALGTGEAFPAVGRASWFSSCIRAGETRQHQESSARMRCTPYCRKSDRIAAIGGANEVLERELYRLCTKKNGVLVFAGTPF